MAKLTNVRTRSLVIFIAVILLIGIGIAMYSTGGGSDEALGVPQTRAARAPAKIESIPGKGPVPTQSYVQIQRAENIKKAEEALKRGGSAVPTFLGQGSRYDAEGYDRDGYDKDGYDRDGYDKNGFDKNGFDRDGYDRDGYDKDGFDRNGLNREGDTREIAACVAGCRKTGGTRKAVDFCIAKCRGQVSEVKQQAPQRVSQQAPQQVSQRQTVQQRPAINTKALEESRKEREARKKAMQAAMANQAKSALSSWVPIRQQYVIGDTTQEAQSTQQQTAPPQSLDEIERTFTPLGVTDENKSAPAAPKSGTMIKAGTILFGVLDTSVNTDEPGPIMARVVGGKYKGARLIGEIQSPKNKKAQKILLAFNLMTMEKFESSIPINAVAIDPTTARTALASDVDNHYLLRYGSLFASSFMEGIGKAIEASGGTTTRGGSSDTTTTTTPELNVTEKILVGLGQTGSEWGKSMKDTFDTPPTITINSGVGIGVLFTQDVQTP